MVGKQISKKMKKSGEEKRLISVGLTGSCGPIRLFVSENERVSSVVEMAVKMFAKESRIQVLGSKSDEFEMYCLTESGWDVLEPSEAILGSQDRRSFRFRLCKRKKPSSLPAAPQTCSRAQIFKSWIRKTLHLSLSSSH